MVFYYAVMAFCIIMTTISQLLLKSGTTKVNSVVEVFLNWKVLLAFSLFFCVTIASVYAMQAIELKVITAWGGLVFPLVTVGAVVILKEPLSTSKVIGTFLVFVGIIIFQLG